MAETTVLWLVNSTHPRSLEALRDSSAIFRGSDVLQVSSVDAALDVLTATEVDCVLITGTVDCSSALEALGAIKTTRPEVRIVFSDLELTAGEAIRLVRAGAAHCFCPRDNWNAVQRAVETAVDESAQHRRRARLARYGTESLVGGGPAMEYVFNTIALVASRKCTVLITGQTGTGKEMAARAIHAASPRAKKPMVCVNCGAIPENLLEAELFGHVKGAFTGAVSSRIGHFEKADGGTIFLDEIGEMPLELQAKLLRVLQEREVQRLGSSDTIKIDVRVIAATNVKLLDKVRQGKFREDLYYRLNVVPLRMPPLRDRRSDIPLLVDHFVEKVCRAEGLPMKTVTPDAKKRLAQMSWPGNVRQLENLVEATIALCGERDQLTETDFGLRPYAVSSAADLKAPPELLGDELDFVSAVRKFEQFLLERALIQTNGNKSAAAQRLGMKRTTLLMKLRERPELREATDLQRAS